MKNNVLKKTLTSLGICLLVLAIILSVLEIKKPVTEDKVIEKNNTQNEEILNETLENDEKGYKDENGNLYINTDTPDDNEIVNLSSNLGNNYSIPVPHEQEDEALNNEDILSMPFDEAEPELFNSGEIKYDDKTLLIKLKNDLDVDNVLKNTGIIKTEELYSIKSGTWYKGFIKENDNIIDIVEILRNTEGVKEAEYNFVWEKTDTLIDSDEYAPVNGVENNNRINDQWYIRSCGIQAAWDYQIENNLPLAGRGMVVAVIDTGVDYTHEDLFNNMWINHGEISDNGIDDDGNGWIDDYYGVDIVNRKGSGKDDNGHGTHVAGIIAGVNNNTGILGVAFNAKIMTIKAGNASGYFLNSDVVEAIRYAYQQGAHVINMSFGGPTRTQAVEDILRNVYTDCVLVAAAGNENRPTEFSPTARPIFPAAFPYVLGVKSCDKYCQKSSFSNWDSMENTKLEYELYAPGSEMLSTIPNNQYAVWSGTSMATPVVSAIAAMARSVYTDYNTYPTKFIYGQLAATGDKNAINDPYNVNTSIVNAFNALTTYPTPKVIFSDYTYFDTPSFVEKNNGDGVVDVGEIISLGYEIWNKWGMAKDSTITVSAYSNAGIPNPYVSFSTELDEEFSDSATVNYGNVGTFSYQDAGRKYEDELWTGWEKPLFIKITDNCPNDMVIDIHADMTSKNALDETDESVYSTNTYTIQLRIRNGVVLPSVIDEDMTLTKDNYYIVSNTVNIVEGVTVNVEPGTNIQFWSSDPNDAYADSAIAKVIVNGQMNFLGTLDEPIKMFPSDLKLGYLVVLEGNIDLYYCDIVNPYISIRNSSKTNRVMHCNFSQSIPATSFNRREVNNGTVINRGSACAVAAPTDTIIDYCSFYKMGIDSKVASDTVNITNNCSHCVFIDSYIRFASYRNYNNCVFYGNNNYTYTKDGWKGSVSSYEIENGFSLPNLEIERTVINKETGKTYALLKLKNISYGQSLPFDFIDAFLEAINGEVAVTNSDDERVFISENIVPATSSYVVYYDYINVDENGIATNKNGEVVNISRDLDAGKYITSYGNNGTYYYTEAYGNNYILAEITGSIYIENIGLKFSDLIMDVNSSYQIETNPYPYNGKSLIYESNNNDIASVSEDGIITPHSIGETVITIFADDRGVYSLLNLTVVDEIPVEGIEVSLENDKLLVGETTKVIYSLLPDNTTKRFVHFQSSDESIAVVDSDGNVTALNPGTAQISVINNANDAIQDSVELTVEMQIESISFNDPVYCTTTESTDDTSFFPIISPSNYTENIKWSSSNPDVVYVDSNGNLIKNKNGVSVIKVEGEKSGVSAEITVSVSDYQPGAKIKTLKQSSDGYVLVLFDNSELWLLGGNDTTPLMLNCSFDIKDVEASRVLYVLGNDNILYRSTEDVTTILNNTKNNSDYLVPLEQVFTDVKKVVTPTICAGYSSDSALFVLRNDGTVWCWNGSNTNGIYGNETYITSNTPVQTNIDNVIDLAVSTKIAVFLKENGELYVSGGQNADNRVNVPTLLLENVVGIQKNPYDYSIDVYTADKFYRIDNYLKTNQYNVVLRDNAEYKVSQNLVYYVEDGHLYVYGTGSYGQLGLGNGVQSTNNQYIEVPGLENVENIWTNFKTTFVQTENGNLYSMGLNTNGQCANLSLSNVFAPNKIIFGLTKNNDTLSMKGANIDEELRLTEDVLSVSFNDALYKNNYYGNIVLKNSNNESISIKKEIELNNLIVVPSVGFIDGETYSLTIPAAAFKSMFGVSNTSISVTFTYYRNNENTEEETDVLPQQGNDDNNIEDAETYINEQVERYYITDEEISNRYTETYNNFYNPKFYNNAILNRLYDDDAENKWLRVLAGQTSSYYVVPVAMNYWGTTNETLIGKQIVDYVDYPGSYAKLRYTPYLSTPSSDCWPFVTKVGIINMDSEEVTSVGNETVTVYVEFNRKMDTDVPLRVRFGSTEPYADYEVKTGEWVSDTRWEGLYTFTTLIESGTNYFSIEDGFSGDDLHLKLFRDYGRFAFTIDLNSALSMNIQAEANDDGIVLTWNQDDFETLIGYNVYRSDSEDGLYTKLNDYLIPADTKRFVDTTPEPGKIYYYNFTVLKSDLTESTPSDKIMIRAKDTMPPGIYPTLIKSAYTGNNLIITATITDNLQVEFAELYYRITGTESWKKVTMSKSNDKYYGSIPSSDISIAGIEYYITAFDGVSFSYSGSQDNPYSVTIYEAIGNDQLGDVNADGKINNLDALMIMQAINDLYNMIPEEFGRADIDNNGELSSAEALLILKYASGKINSLSFH